jgi:hypothetical protein
MEPISPNWVKEGETPISCPSAYNDKFLLYYALKKLLLPMREVKLLKKTNPFLLKLIQVPRLQKQIQHNSYRNIFTSYRN